MRKRVAYCEVPKLAGVYTFAVNLARHLPDFGYDLRLVGVGPQAKADYARSLSLVPADVLAADTTDPTAQRDALLDWIRTNKIDILMVSGSEIEHRLVAALPSHVAAVSVVNNATRGHYRIATTHQDRVRRLVCVSPRLSRDIVRFERVDEAKVVPIPYGVELAPARPVLDEPQRAAHDRGPLRIVYFGRLWDAAKGIFLIPRILAPLRLAGHPFHLTVIGDGPDEGRFASFMKRAGLADCWSHRGLLRYDAVPHELVQHDVQLLPSRHEGLPLTLLEGMAAGCAPIASRLPGITDYVITQPEQGRLCRVGRAMEFTAALADLSRDRQRLRSMQIAARQRIEEAFTARQMAARYAGMFDAILDEPAASVLPRTIPDPPSIKAARRIGFSWRRTIPRPVKNAVRTMCERIGVTV